ncbi:unnamed protein product (macronuclear) [Paramecium tetraurelia]|uniref:Uncharacterized protein n=1 Tax=Paramecium tetraurelia TaxID=5888 RepID=A0D8J3_PARTE|nr:uncharacterized protein GSPATT00014306001 [Paramecium tetraurelia]CAK79360.1 unnamed protein product [Paramecium tetraurelia]|eukprot:XP_001446757.1 hypothetical protein (macronuclear) [Paramecium tetraurelia strain d4-2]
MKTDINDIRFLMKQNNELMQQISHRLNNRNQVFQLEEQLKTERKQFINTTRKVGLLSNQLEKIQQIVLSQKEKLKSQQQLSKSQLRQTQQIPQNQTVEKVRSKSSNIKNVDVGFIKSKIKQALQEVMCEYLD